MNRKKMLPLALLGAGVVVLALLLAVLQFAKSASQQPAISLFGLSAEEIDRVSYSGNSVEETLLKSSTGDWLLESDPALPLDQDVTTSLVETFASLTAQRQLQPEELAEIPAWSDTPLMVFEVGAGDTVHTLTVDQANDVADIYYAYDENGNVYTVAQTDLAGLCKDPRDLYKTQTLTDKTIEDVATMQVEGLYFVQSDDTWTLQEDAGYPLDQAAVKKMANTICGLKTDWTITAPEGEATYGLDTPDVTVTLTFTDGTTLTVRFGNLTSGDESLCYVASSDASALVYEADATYKEAFAVTKGSLYDETATAESAEEEDTIVAEHPVGGKDDYADVTQEE